MGSCAQWLSWKCQMSSGAREHVRVARALRDLPVIRARFGAARAHRQATAADDAAAGSGGGWLAVAEDGSLSGRPAYLAFRGGAAKRCRRCANLAVQTGDPGGDVSADAPRAPARRGPTAAAAHDADITPDTIIPPWYGERLDLDHAIYVCFANARTEEQKQADREQVQEPVFRQDTRGGDFSNTVDYIRRYYDEHPAA